MVIKKKKPRFALDDAFESKKSAKMSAMDRRKAGDLARVRKISPQAGGRLKYGLFIGNRQRKKRI